MNEYKLIFVWVHPTEDFAGELTVKGADFSECFVTGESILDESGLVVIDYYTENK